MSEHENAPLDLELPDGLSDLVEGMRSDVLTDESVQRVGDRLAPIFLGGAGAAGLGAAASTAASAGTSATTAGGAVAGASGAILGGGLTKWVGVAAVLLVGAGASLALMSRSEEATESPAPVRRASMATPASSTEPVEEPPTAEEPVVDDSPRVAPATNRRRRAARQTHLAAAEDPAETAPLPEKTLPQSEAAILEHRQLREARHAIQVDPAKALRLVRDHERDYPQGVLQPEREVIAIEALGRVGRPDEARARAERFMRRWPASPYRHRIESLVN